MDNSNTEKFDVIVIGSGMGGLTAASILTRLKGKKVLVLEKHYVAGGQTHEFHRNQYSWDVGIHYVGALGKGEQARIMMDLVTGKQVKWNEMPDVFDRFKFPDLTIDVHKDPKIFAANLITRFPAEKKSILQYFRDLKSANDWYISNFLSKIPDPIARMPYALRSIGKEKLARMTTKTYMDKSFNDSRLKAVLVAQWGDYGLTPERSSFGIHALVAWGYSAGTGAYFPEGGGRAIAQAVEKVVETAGGRIEVDTEVTEILIENGAAYGVKVVQSNGWQGEFHAETIISNVGAELTFNYLVPASHCQSERAELAGFERGTAMAVLYLGLKDSPEKMGFKGENYWIYESYDIDNSANCIPDLIDGNASYGFLSFPSLKNQGAHAHTAEVCVSADAGVFDQWSDRPADYYQAKDKISASILGLLERNFPGFGDMVDYSELSTPITMEHYTARPKGEPYGIPATPARFDLHALQPRTSVKNLFLAGSDVCSLGIVGALNGGAAAAAAVIGPMGFMRIMIGANIADKKPTPVYPDADIAAHMLTGKIAVIEQKSPTVLELQIKADQRVNFRAGQHVDLQVSGSARRSYSVLSVTNSVLTLVIDTKPDGIGSRYVRQLTNGDKVKFSKPKGSFMLNNHDVPTCFISTGTGMVPVLAMLREVRKNGRNNAPAQFIFGTRARTENYMPAYLGGIDGVSITYCLSRQDKVEGLEFAGRITDYLDANDQNHLNYGETDFYVCGNPNMVQDVLRRLRESGAKNVFVEYY